MNKNGTYHCHSWWCDHGNRCIKFQKTPFYIGFARIFIDKNKIKRNVKYVATQFHQKYQIFFSGLFAKFQKLLN